MSSPLTRPTAADGAPVQPLDVDAAAAARTTLSALSESTRSRAQAHSNLEPSNLEAKLGAKLQNEKAKLKVLKAAVKQMQSEIGSLTEANKSNQRRVKEPEADNCSLNARLAATEEKLIASDKLRKAHEEALERLGEEVAEWQRRVQLVNTDRSMLQGRLAELTAAQPESDLKNGDVPPPETEIVFENQRYLVLVGWKTTILPTDYPAWSDVSGKRRDKEAVVLPSMDWNWVGGWAVEKPQGSRDGWLYGKDYASADHVDQRSTDFVRRRRWIRRRAHRLWQQPASSASPSSVH